MRGRKPLPNVVKLNRGSREPLNAREVSPPRASATPPPDLSPAATAVWTAHVPELVAQGVFSTLDIGRVARTCEVEAHGRALWREAVATEGGDRVLEARAIRCFEVADKVWVSFGCGAPGDRARLRTLAPAQEEDRLAAFRQKYRRA